MEENCVTMIAKVKRFKSAHKGLKINHVLVYKVNADLMYIHIDLSVPYCIDMHLMGYSSIKIDTFSLVLDHNIIIDIIPTGKTEIELFKRAHFMPQFGIDSAMIAVIAPRVGDVHGLEYEEVSIKNVRQKVAWKRK